MRTYLLYGSYPCTDQVLLEFLNFIEAFNDDHDDDDKISYLSWNNIVNVSSLYF